MGQDGCVPVPAGPGLGVTYDVDRINSGEVGRLEIHQLTATFGDLRAWSGMSARERIGLIGSRDIHNIGEKIIV